MHSHIHKITLIRSFCHSHYVITCRVYHSRLTTIVTECLGPWTFITWSATLIEHTISFRFAANNHLDALVCSVLTRIYRPMGTNSISRPRLPSWIYNIISVSTKPSNVYHSQYAFQSTPQTLLSKQFQVAIKNLGWSHGTHCWFWGWPKGHIRALKGHSDLWKRPSENPACLCDYS